MDSLPKPSAETCPHEAARFESALERALEALAVFDMVLLHPDLKRTGMALSSLLFRLRVLSARWPAVSESDSGSPAEPTSVGPSLDAIQNLCRLLSDALGHSRYAEAKPVLNSLLVSLPQAQNEMTRRIYREDLES